MSGHHKHSEHKLSDLEKLPHLLEHWREHNDEHAANYRNWADRAAAAGKTASADLLRQAATVTDQVSALFDEAKKKLA